MIQSHRYRVKGTPKKVLRITLPELDCDRLAFIMELSETEERDDVILKALRYYDAALCGTKLEGSVIYIKHRDGTEEDFAPC